MAAFAAPLPPPPCRGGAGGAGGWRQFLGRPPARGVRFPSSRRRVTPAVGHPPTVSPQRPCASSSPPPPPPASPSSPPPAPVRPLTVRTLGTSGLVVSARGAGTIGWGDPRRGYGTRTTRRDLVAAYEVLLAGGVSFLDTAEVYGYQSIPEGASAECLLGGMALPAAAPSSPVIGTKFFPVPWTAALVGGGVRAGRGAVVDALRASLARLDMPAVDLYSIHFPLPYWGGEAALVDGLAAARDEGLLRAVGVCNYDAPAVGRIASRLRSVGLTLTTNQVAYSLLDRRAETSGTLEACGEAGVTVVAHTPLARGVLTGRSPDALEGAAAEEAAFWRPLTQLMKLVGAFEGGGRVDVTAAQVALNYLVAKGALPIAGVMNEGHARDVVAAGNWALDYNSVAVLEEKALYLQGTKTKRWWGWGGGGGGVGSQGGGGGRS